MRIAKLASTTLAILFLLVVGSCSAVMLSGAIRSCQSP